MKTNAKFVAAVPLIGVNAVAIYGQYGYLQDHLTWPSFAIAGLAITIESIAVYLAYMAHKALIALDSSLRLRLSAYGFGTLAGFMNLSHYSPNWHVSVAGIATGTLSASSPWLWGIYSRRQSRDLLAEKGLIEPGAVRLGNRWIVHPIWCVPVYRYAVWHGIRNPSEAITEYDESKNDRIETADTPEIETEMVPAIENAPDRTPEVPDDAEDVPVYRYAVWHGIRNPSEAITEYDESKNDRIETADTPEIETEMVPAIENAPDRTPEVPDDAEDVPLAGPERSRADTPDRTPVPVPRSKADAVRAALGALGTDVPAARVVDWVGSRTPYRVDPAYVRTVRSKLKAKNDTK